MYRPDFIKSYIAVRSKRVTYLISLISSFHFDDLGNPPWHTLIKIFNIFCRNECPLFLAKLPQLIYIRWSTLATLAFKSDHKGSIMLKSGD